MGYPRGRACATCDFSSLREGPPAALSCRRHAPKPHLSREEASHAVFFPIVLADDWCAEWVKEQRKDVDQA